MVVAEARNAIGEFLSLALLVRALLGPLCWHRTCDEYKGGVRIV
jgi:hypothetical protein